MLGGLALPIRAGAGEIDLTRAVVVVPDGLSSTEEKAVQLAGRGGASTIGHRLGRDASLAGGERARHRGRPGAARSETLPSQIAAARSRRSPRPARLKRASGIQTVDGEPRPRLRSVLVAGNDARGVLFGVGRLLRELRMTPGHGRAARRSSSWRRRRSTRSAAISSAIGPRPTPTTPGTCRSGSATSATWPSSAPTPSS